MTAKGQFPVSTGGLAKQHGRQGSSAVEWRGSLLHIASTSSLLDLEGPGRGLGADEAARKAWSSSHCKEGGISIVNDSSGHTARSPLNCKPESNFKWTYDGA